MWPTITTRRDRKYARARSSLAGRFRPLRMEAMEGRMLLSATTGDHLPLNLHDATLAAANVSLPAVVSQLAATTPSTDGGFILADSLPQLLDADAQSARSQFISSSGNVYLSKDIARLDNHTSESTALFTQDGTIRPRVILPTFGDADGLPIGDLAEFDATVNFAAPSEGGPIAIEPILIAVRSGELLEPAARVSTLLASAPNTTSPVLAGPSARRTDTAITGEWARGMVLQTAGGEPADAASESSPTLIAPDGRGSEKAGLPISAATSAAAGEAAKAEAEPDSMNAHAVSAVLSARPTAERGAPTWDFAQMAAETTTASGSTKSALRGAATAADAIDSESGPHRPSLAAVDEAFDGLSPSEGGIHLSGENLSWRDSFGAAPLLMMLALERIATSSSRRANRDVPISITKQPRRRSDRRLV